MPVQILSNTITIELDALGRGILTLAGAAVLILLAIVFAKLVGTVNRVNKMLDEVTPDLKDAVGRLPQTIQHVNDITGNVVDLTDDIVTEFPVLMSSVSQISETAADLTVSAGSIFNELASVLTALLRFVKRPVASASVVRDVMHTASKLGKKRKAK